MMMLMMIDDVADDDVSLDFFNSNVNKIHICRAGLSLFSSISMVLKPRGGVSFVSDTCHLVRSIEENRRFFV